MSGRNANVDDEEDFFEGSQYMATQQVQDEADEVNDETSVWGKLQLVRGKKFADEPTLTRQLVGPEPFTIGRGRNSSLRIKDPTISVLHCRLYRQENIVYLVDPGSSNGTYLNGQSQRLKKNVPVRITGGDRISLVVARPGSQQSRSSNKTDVSSGNGENGYELIFEDPKTSSVATSPEVDAKYLVCEVLGSGSYATVRRAIHKETNQEYAIKIVNKKQFNFNDPKRWADQINEAHLLRRLDHPGIIHLKELFVTDDALYIVMEYVRGGELYDRLLQGHYKEDRARILTHNILKAVDYLHRQGIVHRDLKPENILLTNKDDDVSIKLADFGVAKEERGGRATFCGSMTYIAPEVLQRRDTVAGLGRYGKGADMWSLGVIVYIVLTTNPPFSDEGNIPVKKQLKQVLKFREQPWRLVSDDAKDFVARLLTVDENQRLTASGALRHRWFSCLNSENSSTPPHTASQEVDLDNENSLPMPPPAPLASNIDLDGKGKRKFPENNGLLGEPNFHAVEAPKKSKVAEFISPRPITSSRKKNPAN